MKAVNFLILQLTVFTCLAQPISLPEPTGEYKVGTREIFMEDPTREENWTEDPDDFRKIMAQLFYPTTDNSDNFSSYAPLPLGKRLDSLLNAFGLTDSNIAEAFIDLKNHSIPNAEVAPGPFPLLVLSHAMMSVTRYNYTALSQELASNGYVVAVIDHTYNNLWMKFEDGITASYAEGWIKLQRPVTPSFQRVFKGQVRVMAADISFVIDQILNLSDNEVYLRNRIDKTQIGVLGHSMGSEAAANAARQDARVSAVCHIDGGSWDMLYDDDEPFKVNKPIFLLRRENAIPTDSVIVEKYLRLGLISAEDTIDYTGNKTELFYKYLSKSWETSYIVSIPGTSHMTFSDLAFLIDNPNISGENPQQSYKVSSQLILIFFNSVMNSEEQSFQEFQRSKFPELDFRVVNLKND